MVGVTHTTNMSSRAKEEVELAKTGPNRDVDADDDSDEFDLEYNKQNVPRKQLRYYFFVYYAAIALAHFVLIVQSMNEDMVNKQWSFLVVVIVLTVLVFDNFVVMLGALSIPRWISEWLGRLRFLALSLSMPWMISYLADLNCRCLPTAEPNTFEIGFFHLIPRVLVVLYILRECAYAMWGLPASALDPSRQQFGDCLPKNALLGGYYVTDTRLFDRTGLRVFVPHPPRTATSAGLALTLVFGILLGYQLYSDGAPAYLLIGSISALCANVIANKNKQLVLGFIGRLVEVGFFACVAWQEQACAHPGRVCAVAAGP